MAKSPVTIIRPAKRFASISFAELWEYRALLGSLIRRRIKTEFDQQYLAYVWVVLRPLLMVALFATFRHLSNADTAVKMPYALYVYTGLAFWFFFVEAVQQTATSLKENAGLIQKVYFPRVLVPISAIAANFYMFSITAVPLLAMMFWYSAFPGANILMLPLVLLSAALLIFGVGCIFASLGVGNRDWDRFLGFALYIGLFVSPVIYDPGMINEAARPWYSLNPMVGTLMGFRSALFDSVPFPWTEWLYTCVFAVVVMGIGLLMFQNVESHVSDRL